MDALVVILHTLHLLFAVFWLGSYFYTEAILWPRMRAAGMLADVQGGLRSPEVRRLNAIPIVGTVVTGFARGVADGAAARLTEPYGMLFVAAGFVGFGMVTWWLSFPPRSMVWGWRAFYSGFWIIFALMIGLRFTA